jgi:hypothetical protein
MLEKLSTHASFKAHGKRLLLLLLHVMEQPIEALFTVRRHKLRRKTVRHSMWSYRMRSSHQEIVPNRRAPDVLMAFDL